MMESGFELMTPGSDTMLNHHLYKKFKLIGINKFSYLINTLTFTIPHFTLISMH
jgi:hypothetical protein